MANIYVPAGRGLVLSVSRDDDYAARFRLVLWRAPSAAERKRGMQAKDMVAFVSAEAGVTPRLEPAGDEQSTACVWLGPASFDLPDKSLTRLAEWLAALPTRDAPTASPAARAPLLTTELSA
ncbi:hypothetical protein [Luteimonas saliphila]|uniref:hypothetical protein n=1 Tax=Luteimonas saliphila TaxID=2804919 RepID=UPI00192E1FC4|nr:hypothetical protein [Luteimonas saliphila]